MRTPITYTSPATIYAEGFLMHTRTERYAWLRGKGKAQAQLVEHVSRSSLAVEEETGLDDDDAVQRLHGEVHGSRTIQDSVLLPATGNGSSSRTERCVRAHGHQL